MRIFLFFVFACLFLFAPVAEVFPEGNIVLYSRGYENTYDNKNKNISLEIECHSGTPPVLEFVLTDKEKIVKKLYYDFDNDGEIDLETGGLREGEKGDEVVFRGVPYREKGVYTLSVYLETFYGTLMREYVVSFTDFVWGRDNFNFANDGKFENTINFVSTTVIKWAEERFGNLTQDQQAILLHVMYSMYKGSIGRCYGFSGGEVYGLEHPDKFLPLYLTTYSLDENDGKIIQEMDYVQNDIVFSYFISGQIDIEKKQDFVGLISELKKIKDSIGSGRPIILGYLSIKMHHSMVVYGYFENTFKNSTTLLVANNWERKQNSNVFSEDAENIVVQFMNENAKVSWYDLTKKKYRYPRMIFAIVREENYHLDPVDFFNLIENTENRICENDKIIIMIEMTETAYIVDDKGKKKGYSKPKYFREVEDISFKKVDYNYIFEIPKGREYTLILKKGRYNKEQKKQKDVNVYGIIPLGPDIQSVVYNRIPVDDNLETVFTINEEGIKLMK